MECNSVHSRRLHSFDQNGPVEQRQYPNSGISGTVSHKGVTAYVASFISGQQLGAFLIQYGTIIEVKPDREMEECWFCLMIGKKNFNAVPKWIDINGKKVPVVSQGKNPAS